MALYRRYSFEIVLTVALLSALCLIADGVGMVFGADAGDMTVEFSAYMPGEPMLQTCARQSFTYQEYWRQCALHSDECLHGMALGDDERFTYLSLWQCRFPLFALTVRYGHPVTAYRYRTGARLYWPEARVSAMVRDRWYDLQSHVYYVSWSR